CAVAARSAPSSSVPVVTRHSNPHPGSCQNDAHLPASAHRSTRSTSPLPSPASVAPPPGNSASRSAQCARYIHQSVRSTTRSLPATVPVPFSVLDSTPAPSPGSCSADYSRATVLRKTWSVPAPWSPAPSALAPVPLAPGSPSDPLAPARCDASPAPATADRSPPVEPAFGHRADHLSCDSLRSSAHGAHAPRSLRDPVHSTPGSPMASASPFPTPAGCAASRGRLPSWPSLWSPLSVPEPLLPLHLECSTN